MVEVGYVNLAAQWEQEKNDLLPIIEGVLAKGDYVAGAKVQSFENIVNITIGSKFCVALNSGTDALVCAMVALGIKAGDEVITPPNSFIASTASIIHIGAKPVFVDVLEDQNLDPSKIEDAITNKTRAIMPVHLTGKTCKMDDIMSIAKKYDLKVIEDSAQSIGSKYLNTKAGLFGDVGCFSAHPLKNLNACGDAGFLVTNSKEIADKVRTMRNHGLVDRNTVSQFGYVSRMDTIQAAILEYRMSKLPEVIKKRRANAERYITLLQNLDIHLPIETPNEFNTFHTFVIQLANRDYVKSELENRGIETSIHYPVPIHLQPAAAKLNYKLGDFPVTESQAANILTLPINQFLSSDDIDYVCQNLVDIVA